MRIKRKLLNEPDLVRQEEDDMFRQLLTGTLALLMVGCASLQEQSPEEFAALVQQSNTAAKVVSNILSRELEPEQRAEIKSALSVLKETVESNTLGQTSDAIGLVVELLGERVGNEESRELMQDIVLLLDIAFGQLTVDISGVMDPRSQELLVAVLDGLILRL